MSCYYENSGCLAANVITTGDVITCEMTTGLSKESDMMDDSTSVLYVASKQFEKCSSERMKLSISMSIISPLRKIIILSWLSNSHLQINIFWGVII